MHYKHGMTGTATYKSWKQMMKRCYSPGATYYADYGGRGITVCERWHDFRNFFADMGARPDGFVLDRKDNDAGYKPDNCRWANAQISAHNKRKSRNSRSRYKGVTSLRGKKWQAWVRFHGKLHYLGTFPTEEEAAISYNVGAVRCFGSNASLNQVYEG